MTQKGIDSSRPVTEGDKNSERSDFGGPMAFAEIDVKPANEMAYLGNAVAHRFGSTAVGRQGQ